MFRVAIDGRDVPTMRSEQGGKDAGARAHFEDGRARGEREKPEVGSIALGRRRGPKLLTVTALSLYACRRPRLNTNPTTNAQTTPITNSIAIRRIG